MKANKNYLITGKRNLNLGQIEYARHLLVYIFKNGNLIPTEQVAVRDAIIKLESIHKLPANKRQEIFGKINGFKKYQENDKIQISEVLSKLT